MRITFDPRKRDKTLFERGLDFGPAPEVFDGINMTIEDVRCDYGEHRYITVGHLDERVVVIAWTRRGKARRIISMRKANEREIKQFIRNLD